MGKPKVFLQKLARATKRKSPVIFLVAGIAAGVSAVVVAVKQTAEAKDIVDSETQIKTYQENDPSAKLTKKEIVKATWKKYIPVVALVLVSVFFILSSAGVVHRRYESLVAAYGLLSSYKEDYVNKVIETVGKQQEKNITDDIVKDKVKAIHKAVPTESLGEPEEGKILFFDIWTGTKFYATHEYVRGVINKMNDRLIRYPGDYETLSDYCSELHIKGPTPKVFNKMGWTFECGLINVEFVYMTDDDDITPLIGIKHKNEPTYLPVC